MLNIKNILTESINNEHTKPTILYRGTNHDLDFLSNKMVWASNDVNVAKEYGKILYQLNIEKPYKLFDSLDFNDIKLLYDKGFKLIDDYLEEEDIEGSGIDGYWDSSGEYVVFNTAESYYHDSSNSDSDTWRAIEYSPGVLDFLKNNYDIAHITEGGSESNYLIFNHNIIANYTRIK